MSRELHSTRLATTDENGNRVYLHPEDIKGTWKSRRKKFYWFLIGLYLVLPWVHINGKQWVKLDLTNRQFTIFGEMFYGHDGPLLIFLFLGFLFFIAFITSLWGRVWCGWGCPQTVFIDSIFRPIERLIEGKSRARAKLDAQEWNLEKIIKRSIKWALYAIVSLHIVHSFLGYFVGTHYLLEISTQSPLKHPELFVTMLVMTAITLFDFGWFREQFCIIACPYGRFQSVLMDESSLVVAYDANRGEPRRGVAETKESEGDCINCFRCVKACPTGIDIRRGTQLECIACTMCIDACDEIMTRLKRPKGLVRYASQSELEGKKRKVPIRTYLYGIIFVSLIFGLAFSLDYRRGLGLQFLRAQEEPYRMVGETTVINHFDLKVNYYHSNGHRLEILAPKNIEIVSPMLPLIIKEANSKLVVFFKFDKNLLVNGESIITLKAMLYKKQQLIEEKTIEVKLVGPFK